MADRRGGHGRSGKQPGSGVGSLVGSGPSLVSPVGAMRARDVSRPKDSDVARAEKTVVVRRRPADAPETAVRTPAIPASTSPAAAPGDLDASDQSSAGASEPLDS